LLTIINDILDISRIEAGRLVIEKVDFDPVALVSNNALKFTSQGTKFV